MQPEYQPTKQLIQPINNVLKLIGSKKETQSMFHLKNIALLEKAKLVLKTQPEKDKCDKTIDNLRSQLIVVK